MSLSNASVVRLAASSILKEARASIRAKNIVARAVEIQQIPAPTFDEEKRGLFVTEQFRALGLQNVEMDGLYNVYGWLPDASPDAPVLLISAHTDTVFPASVDLSIRRDGDRVYGPGIGDNSLGVAALLSLAELFLRYPIPHTTGVCFVANSREEGLGDLGGINAVIDHLKGRINSAIVIEGMALGRIYHGGIGVRRLKITVTAPGGHSWLHFGSPSAIHKLIQFGHDFLTEAPANLPRTTYNIGLIEGGSSINTIAAQSTCHIDLRSDNPEALQKLEAQVYDLATRHSTDGASFQVEVVGSRPSGLISTDHPLVRLAVAAHHAIRMSPELESGSTDANALLARDIPTVCVGVAYGGSAHTQEEYIDIPPIEEGMWQLLLLATAAANMSIQGRSSL